MIVSPAPLFAGNEIVTFDRLFPFIMISLEGSVAFGRVVDDNSSSGGEVFVTGDM